MAESWAPTNRLMPDDGQCVDWITSGGEVVEGGLYRGRLWFLPPDHAMYAYYCPAFWRPAKEATDAR